MTLDKENFDCLQIKIASPDRIKEWGQRVLPNGEIIGEVTKTETLNYRTLKPEPSGLLCQKIFGPIKSWECYCGRYKIQPRKISAEALFCENCGVELTETRVRRHRMGHIKLNFPVTHVWYLKGSPSYISLLLEIPLKKLEKIIYFHDQSYEDEEDFLMKFFTNNDEKMEKMLDLFLKENEEELAIIKSGSKSFLENQKKDESLNLKESKNADILDSFKSSIKLKKDTKQTLSQDKEDLFLDDESFIDENSSFDFSSLPDFSEEFFDDDDQNNGANLVLELLKNLNLQEEITKARSDLIDSPVTKKEKIIKRLRILENFLTTKSNPSWMVLTILPVLPPALRPIIELETGRLATSELNEQYRRIITRNNRLKRLTQRFAPLSVICNEKRMLQEAVDALIDNGKRGGRIAYNLNNRPLRCLSEIISGKQGRFRQNLLGKRVDYSGRSVIIVGPNLRLNQCGLPYEMAIELFKPYLIYNLMKLGIVRTIKTAKMLIEENTNVISDIIQFIAHEHPIFLNRAPTLHRLGIQAFDPIITNGRAIQLHPLVCPSFNADFDGDQMAVHVPLSEKSKEEARSLMKISQNFLSSATGRPVLTPSQDMVLGWYYLTSRPTTKLKGRYHYFAKVANVLKAFEYEELSVHSPIWVRYLGEVEEKPSNQAKIIKKEWFNDKEWLEIYEEIQIKKDKNGNTINQYIKTTPGRILLNEMIGVTMKSHNGN